MTRPVALARVTAGCAGLALALVALPATGQGSAAGGRGEPQNSAGRSQYLDSSALSVRRARFEAGARSSWHSHRFDCWIIAEDGEGRVQIKGQPIVELKKGQSHYTPAGMLHWHGAAPNVAFTQLGVALGPGVDYGDPVTDAQYLGTSK